MPKAPADLRSLARAHTKEAVQTLAGIMRAGTSEPARVSACALLLDRGWGKPQQDVTLDANIRVTIRKMLSDDDDIGELIDVTPIQNKIEKSDQED